MFVSNHLTRFCYPTRLMLHQHLNFLVAYPGNPRENLNHSQGQHQQQSEKSTRVLFSDYSGQSLTKSERRFSTSVTLELYFDQPHCAGINMHGNYL